MQTQVLPVHAERPEPEIIQKAVEILRRGGLVAFPTETVYGIGANALDAEAAQSIFNAKGRPARNPLIVHVPNAEAVEQVAQSWPKDAAILAEHFWPGPMTLVLPKKSCVPATVTGGGHTVAVRVPAHPVAQALLRAVELPIAAPSANRSSRLSPTEAKHVLRDLEGMIHLLLDGGPTTRGIESTVIDLSVPSPLILRPGMISVDSIEKVLGKHVELGFKQRLVPGQPLTSPGLLEKHYSPYTPLEITETNETGRQRIEELIRKGLRVGWVPLANEEASAPSNKVIVMPLPMDPVIYAQKFYATLHTLDLLSTARIFVTLPPDTPAWMAVRDRLLRASHNSN
ncbi:MAG TPA: L-threonylcarbamoyladenylate synthase [Gemmatales bacterium]|nr:L-threonylcarbamoyladenylate synthase [Gemmatales bacterium]